jgi:hypothetical protein
MEQKKEIWHAFCRNHRILEQSVLLFETEGQRVIVFPYGANQRGVLKRSEAMN